MVSVSYFRMLTLAVACAPIYMLAQMAPAHDTDMNNPYTASIIAGMLPLNKTEEKIKILEGIVAQVESLAPDLGLLESYFEANQFKNVVALLEKTKGLKELIVEHPRAGLVVVKSFVKLGMNDEAIDLLVKLNVKNPTDQEIAFLTALFYEQKNEVTNALKVADNYLNKSIKRQSNFAFLFLKSRLYTKLGDTKNALINIEEALKIQPSFEMGWFMFAQMKETKGEMEAAIKGYTNYLDNAASKPSNAATQMLMRSIETKLLKMMFELTIKKNPNPEHTHIERCRNQVIQLFQQKKYKDVLQVLDNCLAGKENTEEARLMKIQALGALKEYDQAAQLITGWIIEDPQNSLWFEALHLLYFAGLDSQKLIAALLEIDKKCPHNLFASLYLADMYTRTAEHTSAITYHKKALELTDEADLQTSIYFQLGLLYYETEQYQEMKTALERGKELGLEYAPLLNLLAYHYITKDNNLKSAQELMETVLKDSPDNPHFLDTQAMLLIKQGKENEAVVILEKIAKQEPDDATIAHHLAKAYKKLGRTAQAVACLQEAAQLTFDTHKKQKYQQIAAEWKTETHGKKHDSVLCSR